MTASEIIRKKRDSQANTTAEIEFLVRGSLDGTVPRYQISAWLMAIFFNGMTSEETMALTRSFIDSGEVVQYPEGSGCLVDKHSTGGVGDKTSLVVAPIVAAAGLRVPMISGRGLGHTGGTLDKLEAIPGFQTDLSLDRFRDQVASIGLSLIGATGELAPADRLFYSLRDVTSTVESIPLIVASILSKKAAEGIDALVLDVKTGSGAFMKEPEAADHLARRLVEAWGLLGKRVVALVTDMSQPLGLKVGNALEVEECIELLKGRGPADLRQLCLELAAQMISLCQSDQPLEAARRIARKQLDSGAALAKFAELIEHQGGDPGVIENPEKMARAATRRPILAEQDGYIASARADRMGQAAMLLGAGRLRAADTIDPAAGLLLHKKLGDSVSRGEPLATLFYNDGSRLEDALLKIKESFLIGDEPAAAPSLIHKVVQP